MRAATGGEEAEVIESPVLPVNSFSAIPGFFDQKAQRGKMQSGKGVGMKAPIVTRLGMTARGVREPGLGGGMGVELSESVHA